MPTATGLALAALVGVLSGPGEARNVSFRGVEGLGLDPALADELGRAVEAGLRSVEGVTLVPGLDSAETCGREARCFCDAARAQGPTADTAVVANVGRIDVIYSIELLRFDLSRCSLENSTFVTEPHTERTAVLRLEALARRLLRPRETVSETAVKSERDVWVVPAMVQVLPDTELSDLGAHSLSDVLPLVPGFEVVETNWGDIVLHHGLSSTLLYMIDGVPLSNPMFNFRYLGRDFGLSLNHVDRLEVVRGPGSVAWGQNAFLGVVNLITKDPSVRGDRLSGHLRLGSFDSQEVSAGVEGGHGWVGYYLSGTVRRGKGPTTRLSDSILANLGAASPTFGNGGATKNAADRSLELVGKIRLLGKLEVLVSYWASDNPFEISPFGSLLRSDDLGVWQLQDAVIAASYEDELGAGFHLRISASRYQHTVWERFIVHPKSEILPNGFSSIQGNEAAPQLNHLLEGRLHHQLGSGDFSNRAVLGASFLHQALPDEFATVTAEDGSPGQEALDYAAHDQTTASVFVLNELGFFRERVVASGGARYDHHDAFRSKLTVQGALVVGAPGASLKLLYAEGFRPPAANDLYSTKGTLGNPGLRPEQSQALTVEAAVSPLEWLDLSAAGSSIWLRDLIRLEEASEEQKRRGFAYFPKNAARLHLYAASFEARARWSRHSHAKLGYAFKTLAGSAEDAERIPLAHHTASAGLSISATDSLRFFSTAVFTSPRTLQVLRPEGVTTQTLPASISSDFGVSLSEILGLLEVTIEGRNLFSANRLSPYVLDGRPTPMLEPRTGAELLITLRADSGILSLGEEARIASPERINEIE